MPCPPENGKGFMFSLPFEARVAVVSHLVEGNSVRATERLTGVTKKTILRMLADIGAGCDRLHDRIVRDLNITNIQIDEIWSYVQKKQARVTEEDDPTRGDAYTYFALARGAKLVIAYRVGKRDQATTDLFIADLRARLLTVPTMSTDGFAAYPIAIGQSFEAVDYSVVQKNYSRSPRRVRDGQPSDHRYEPPRDPFITRTPVYGAPNMSQCSTSHVERANLTMRMQIRRFTRLCNGFSKKIENHVHAVALHFAYYNFCRIHESIRVTPAMEAGLTDHVWSVAELVRTALAEVPAEKPVKKPLALPKVEAEATAAPSRELPGGRGFLRLVSGGAAPSPKPSPTTPTPASPAASASTATPIPTPAGLAAKAPRPPVQLSLFGEEDDPVV